MGEGVSKIGKISDVVYGWFLTTSSTTIRTFCQIKATKSKEACCCKRHHLVNSVLREHLIFICFVANICPIDELKLQSHRWVWLVYLHFGHFEKNNWTTTLEFQLKSSTGQNFVEKTFHWKCKMQQKKICKCMLSQKRFRPILRLGIAVEMKAAEWQMILRFSFYLVDYFLLQFE